MAEEGEGTGEGRLGRRRKHRSPSVLDHFVSSFLLSLAGLWGFLGPEVEEEALRGVVTRRYQAQGVQSADKRKYSLEPLSAPECLDGRGDCSAKRRRWRIYGSCRGRLERGGSRAR